jgi:GrpB-like predicted nucleotidyltransferase (UPF0157 family)
MQEEMTKEDLGKLYPIEVIKYDPDWPIQFEREKKESFPVHMGPKDQDWLWDRLNFRNYLRKNSSELKKYQDLKTELAIKHKHEREAYTDRKAGYIKEVTKSAKYEMQREYLN